MNWKTIDSAPMDGTAILVMQNNWPGTKTGRAEICDGMPDYSNALDAATEPATIVTLRYNLKLDG